MSKSALSPIEQTIRRHIKDHFSDPDACHFVVGVSGGPDSMCLLHALHKLDVSASVVHVNYQKRGADSDRDARLVARMADKWSFDCRIHTADPAEAEGQNFQQWARRRRYRLLEKAARNRPSTGIAVAHHQDDQIETILQKLFRGAGLASWSGMSVWDGRLFRPMLDISSEEIMDYVEGNDIPYRMDASNLKSDFARNFLRNEWLTELSDFFPGWKQNVLRMPQQAKGFEQAVHWISHRLAEGEKIDRPALHSLTEDLQKAVLLYLLKQRDETVKISRPALEQLDRLPQLQTGQSIRLTAQFSIVRDRNHYRIVEEKEPSFPSLLLEKPTLKQQGYAIGPIRLSAISGEISWEGPYLLLDMDTLSWPLTLRLWQDGDRFQPLGMEGHQLVSDHLTNRKISAAHKRETLVIESFEERICAVIFPSIKNKAAVGTISEHAKCTSGTQQYLKITYSTRR